MKDQTTRVLNATAAGLEVMDANNALWSGKVAISDKYSAVKAKALQITQLDEQITDGSGVVTAKAMAKQHAAMLALSIGKPMAVFAKDTHNLELFGEIDFSWSALRYVKDQTCIDRWQLIHDRAMTHETALVTDSYMESGAPALLQTAIAGFVAQRGKPVAKRSNTKALNNSIDTCTKELSALNLELINLLVPFQETDPDFYTAAKAAFAVDQTGTRHLALRIRYTDEATGIRLFGVRATIQETGLTAISSKNGIISFWQQQLPTGNYVLRSELLNYQASVIENVGIDHQKVKSIDVVMKKSDSGTTTGTVMGTVRYLGAPIKDATISVQGQTVTTITDGNGKYVLNSVATGNITVTATLPPAQGSATQSKTIDLAEGQTFTIDFEF
jgi:hypothetical protein